MLDFDTTRHGSHCACKILAEAVGYDHMSISFRFCRNFLMRHRVVECNHGWTTASLWLSGSGADQSRDPNLAADWADKNLYKITKQIHELTDVPLLTPEKYRKLIASIAWDVAEAPFHLMETGKRVRDRCIETGCR